MKKNILIIVLIALVLIGFGHSIYNKNTSVKKARISAEIVVEEGISNKASLIIEGTTALDYIKNQTQVKTKGEGVNAYIVEISGRKADESKREYWAFYVNGKMAEVGAGSYELKDGDKIEWKIEKY